MRICKLIYYLKSNQIKPGPERQIRILGSASRRKGFTPGSRLAVCDVRARERRKMSHPVDARHPRRGQAGGALNGPPHPTDRRRYPVFYHPGWVGVAHFRPAGQPGSGTPHRRRAAHAPRPLAVAHAAPGSFLAGSWDATRLTTRSHVRCDVPGRFGLLN